MKTAEEILDEHCIELREEFLTTAKSRKFKQKVLAAMEDYDGSGDMNIYKLEQDINNDYDTFDSCIVVASSEKDARDIHPYVDIVTHITNNRWMGTFSGSENKGKEYETQNDGHSTWVSRTDIDKIKVTLIGVATKGQKPGVLLTSFNAG